MPILMALYYFNVKNKNVLFIIALIIISIGVFFLNSSNSTVDILGLLCYTLGALFYAIIIVKQSPLFTLKRMIYTIPIVLSFFVIGSFYFLKSVEEPLFYYVMAYVIITASLLYFSLLNFVTSKTLRNTYLLLSAVLLVCSTLLSGYSFFIYRVAISTVAEVLCFSLSHFCMTLYMLKKSEEETLNFI